MSAPDVGPGNYPKHDHFNETRMPFSSMEKSIVFAILIAFFPFESANAGIGQRIETINGLNVSFWRYGIIKLELSGEYVLQLRFVTESERINIKAEKDDEYLIQAAMDVCENHSDELLKSFFDQWSGEPPDYILIKFTRETGSIETFHHNVSWAFGFYFDGQKCGSPALDEAE